MENMISSLDTYFQDTPPQSKEAFNNCQTIKVQHGAPPPCLHCRSKWRSLHEVLLNWNHLCNAHFLFTNGGVYLHSRCDQCGCSSLFVLYKKIKQLKIPIVADKTYCHGLDRIGFIYKLRLSTTVERHIRDRVFYTYGAKICPSFILAS